MEDDDPFLPKNLKELTEMIMNEIIKQEECPTDEYPFAG